MQKYNANYEIIIYPSEKGWEKIRSIISSIYKLDGRRLDAYIKSKTTPENGFKDQMWCIMSDFGEMYFNGTSYFSTMNIDLCFDE
jgi:hypothetical protein